MFSDYCRVKLTIIKDYFSTRGGGAYYSFYLKIPDYGYGSDIMLERDRFFCVERWFDD